MKLRRTIHFLAPLGLGVMVLVGLFGPSADGATSYSWTNTPAASDYWTNNLNWKPNTAYPGQASGDSAFLTNNAASTYTNVLNLSPAFTISSTTISNSSGQAWLAVTNAVLTNTTLAVGTGGRLRIDNGGIVTNVTTLTLDKTGNGGQIYVNSGGQLFTPAAVTVGNGGSNYLVQVSGSGALWNLGGNNLFVGSGQATGNVVRIDGQGVTGGAIVTNVNQVLVGQSGGFGNSLIITNGGQLWSTSGGTGPFIGNNRSTNNSVVVVGGSSATSLWNGGAKTLVIGRAVSTGNVLRVDGAGVSGSAIVTNLTITVGDNTSPGGSSDNNLLVTNGGRLWSTSTTTIGLGSSNNTIQIVGGTASSLWNGNAGALTIGTGAATGNVLRVDGLGVSGGAVVTNINGITVGTSGSGGNSLIITNGGQLWTIAGSTIGNGTASNTVLVLGGGAATSLWNALGNALSFGNAPLGVSTGNVLRIDGGGSAGSAIATNVGQLLMGIASIGNSVIVTNGGQLWTVSSVVIGGSGTSGGTNNSIFVTGGAATSRWDAKNQNITVGNTTGANTANGNSLRVGSGGIVSNVNTLAIGVGSGTANSSVVVQGGKLVVTTLNNGDGNSTGSLLDIVGGGGTLTASTYTQFASSTVKYEFASAATVSDGISGLNVSGTATRGGTLALQLHGGVARFDATNTASFLTAGTLAGSFATTNRGVFTVSTVGSTMQASLDNSLKRLASPLILGQPQALAAPGFNLGWFEVSTNNLAGFNTYGIDLTITNAGAGHTIGDLATYLGDSGYALNVITNGTSNTYDFRISLFVTPTTTSNTVFAWDFSPLDSQFLVTNAGLFIPEPSLLFLLGCGGWVCWRFRRRAVSRQNG